MNQPDTDLTEVTAVARSRTRNMIERCTPLPAQLQLANAGTSAAQQRADARLDALLGGGIAVLPILMVCAAMRELRFDRGSAAIVGAILLAAVSLTMFLRVRLDRTRVWNQRKWLDFTDRTWRSAKTYAHPTMPDENRVLPFTSLVLVCYNASLEDSIKFGLDLCHFSDMAEYCHYQSQHTHHIFEHEDEQAVLDFGLKLAKLWGVDCWKYHAPDAGGLRQLYKAQLP